MNKILILYYSKHQSIQQMARYIALGVESQHCEAVLRTVADSPCQDDPIIGEQDLIDCHGLIVGSPAQFGNMAAELKKFWDSTSALWLQGRLINKPGAVFTSSSSQHGGNESTLLSMMLPLLHHGMVIAGLPYSHPELIKTTSGGTPYGVSHVAGTFNDRPFSDDEITLCKAQGARIANFSQQLS